MAQTPMTEEQLRWIAEQTEHAAHKASRRTAIKASVGYVALVAILLVASSMWYGALRSGLEASCGRVNILRAQSNFSDYIQWQDKVDVVRRETALAKADDPATRKVHKDSAARFAARADRLTITGITDCESAVGDPEHYAQPVAKPIGNPYTGRIYPNIERALEDSRNVLVVATRKG